MITAAKLRLYQQYEGDLDGFARTASAAQRTLFPSREWGQLEELLANVRLEEDGLLADSFRQRLHQQLETECDTAETLALLRQAARPASPTRRRANGWLLVVGIGLLVLLLVGGYLIVTTR